MQKLEVGMKFSFGKVQQGVIYYKVNNALGPFVITAGYYEKVFRMAAKYGHRRFTGSEKFEVVKAYDAIGGWYVVAKMVDSDVRVCFFQQLEEEGKKFVEVEVH